MSIRKRKCLRKPFHSRRKSWSSGPTPTRDYQVCVYVCMCIWVGGWVGGSVCVGNFFSFLFWSCLHSYYVFFIIMYSLLVWFELLQNQICLSLARFDLVSTTNKKFVSQACCINNKLKQTLFSQVIMLAYSCCILRRLNAIFLRRDRSYLRLKLLPAVRTVFLSSLCSVSFSVVSLSSALSRSLSSLLLRSSLFPLSVTLCCSLSDTRTERYPPAVREAADQGQGGGDETPSPVAASSGILEASPMGSDIGVSFNAAGVDEGVAEQVWFDVVCDSILALSLSSLLSLGLSLSNSSFCSFPFSFFLSFFLSFVLSVLCRAFYISWRFAMWGPIRCFQFAVADPVSHSLSLTAFFLVSLSTSLDGFLCGVP